LPNLDSKHWSVRKLNLIPSTRNVNQKGQALCVEFNNFYMSLINKRILKLNFQTALSLALGILQTAINEL